MIKKAYHSFLQEKYSHLIGTDADIAAARKAELKKSFGMVSAESKKDKRSVEDIQNDLRAKKMKKMTGEPGNGASLT